MAMMLLLLLSCLYFTVWRAARKEGEDFTGYAARNFRYLRNLSFLSDLLIKFVVLALLIMAPKPEWIGPMLLAFTADYLIQGRFFVLPPAISLPAALVCLGLAVYQFSLGSTVLILPLVVFIVCAIASLLTVIRSMKRNA